MMWPAVLCALSMWFMNTAASPQPPETVFRGGAAPRQKTNEAQDRDAALSSYFSETDSDSAARSSISSDGNVPPEKQNHELPLARAYYHLQRLKIVRRSQDSNRTSMRKFSAIHFCVSLRDLQLRMPFRSHCCSASLFSNLSESPERTRFQICAQGVVNTAISGATGSSSLDSNVIEIFQSNEVCHKSELSGRIVVQAEYPGNMASPNRLISSLLRKTKQSSSTTEFQPMLDINCDSSDRMNSTHPFQRSPFTVHHNVSQRGTPANLVFIEFGSHEIAMLEESSKDWGKLHDPNLAPSTPSFPSQMNMKQLEDEISKLGKIGTLYGADRNATYAGSVVQIKSAVTERERVDSKQCGELSRAFAECVKKSTDIGLCTDERARYESCHRDVANEYRFKSYVNNKIKSATKACGGILPCHDHPMQGPLIGLSSTLGLPNPLPSWPLFGPDLSGAAGVILMTIIMGTLGRAIPILANKFGMKFASAIPPIIMAALVFGLPKCPPLPPPVLWLIPGCGPKCPPVPEWLLKLLPGFWEKCAGPKSKASEPAMDMAKLDDLKDKAKAALDASNAALAADKVALDKARKKAGKDIAAAKAAAATASSEPLLELAKASMKEVGFAEDAVEAAAKDSATAAEDYAAALQARSANRKNLLDEVTAAAAKSVKHTNQYADRLTHKVQLPVHRNMSSFQHRKFADRWQTAAGSLCDLLKGAARDVTNDVQLSQVAMARQDIKRVRSLAIASRSQIQYAGFHIDRAGFIDSDDLKSEILRLDVDKRLNWSIAQARDRRNDFIRLHNISVGLASCAEQAKSALLKCVDMVKNTLSKGDDKHKYSMRSRPGNALKNSPSLHSERNEGDRGIIFSVKESTHSGRPDVMDLEPSEWNAETPPSMFVSTEESVNLQPSRSNFLLNASTTDVLLLYKEINRTLYSLERLQNELHREDKVTLYEARRTWLFARRLSDLYGGGHFVGEKESRAYNRILKEIDRVIQNDRDQVDLLKKQQDWNSQKIGNGIKKIAASTLAATSFIEEYEEDRVFSLSAMSLRIAKGARQPPGKMSGSIVQMLVKQLSDADTVMYTRLITERAAPMIKRSIATRFGTEVNGESKIQASIGDMLLKSFSSILPRALASLVPHTLNAILPNVMMHKYKTVLPNVLTRSLVHSLTPTLVHTLSSSFANQHRSSGKEKIISVWSTFYESYYSDYFTNKTHYDPSEAAIKARESSEKL